jgi:predicted small secreted protein
MKLVALLALAITLLAGSENTADSGYGIDPNGSTQSSQSSQSNDIGCGIDPNGCNG